MEIPSKKFLKYLVYLLRITFQEIPKIPFSRNSRKHSSLFYWEFPEKLYKSGFLVALKVLAKYLYVCHVPLTLIETMPLWQDTRTSRNGILAVSYVICCRDIHVICLGEIPNEEVRVAHWKI